MAIKKKSEIDKNPIIIDLTGPEGNAYCLLGYASSYAKQLGLDKDEIEKEMTSGDYEHLVETFDKHFGHFVTLLR